MHSEIIIKNISNIPEIQSNDDLSKIIISALKKNRLKLKNKDVLVITQKIISKSENRLVHRNNALTQLILDESQRIIKKKYGVIITETNHGFICANSGIDQSNIPPNYFCLLPINPDKSAKKIRIALENEFNVKLGIIISDTFGRPFRSGQTDVAIGVSGISPLLNYKGKNE